MPSTVVPDTISTDVPGVPVPDRVSVLPEISGWLRVGGTLEVAGAVLAAAPAADVVVTAAEDAARAVEVIVSDGFALDCVAPGVLAEVSDAVSDAVAAGVVVVTVVLAPAAVVTVFASVAMAAVTSVVAVTAAVAFVAGAAKAVVVVAGTAAATAVIVVVAAAAAAVAVGAAVEVTTAAVACELVAPASTVVPPAGTVNETTREYWTLLSAGLIARIRNA